MKSDEAVTFEGLDQHEENCRDTCNVGQGGEKLVLAAKRWADRRSRSGGRIHWSCSRAINRRLRDLSWHPGPSAATGTEDNIVGHFGVTLWTGSRHDFQARRALSFLRQSSQTP